MRLPAFLFLLSSVLLASPVALADDETNIVSDLNAAFTVATPDNPDVLGLEPGLKLGGRLRFDGVPFQGFPFAFSLDLAGYGPLSLWEASTSFGTGYWFGFAGFSLLGGVGLEAGGESPRKAPVFLTLNLQATAAVDLGDMFRLRMWVKPTWLATSIQSDEGTAPVADFTGTHPLLTIAGRTSDELNVGAALAFTLPKRGPANHLYNGSATFWVGTEYRAALRNKMVGIFVGYGAATGAYNGAPL
jgi:hypothetical protein